MPLLNSLSVSTSAVIKHLATKAEMASKAKMNVFASQQLNKNASNQGRPNRPNSPNSPNSLSRSASTNTSPGTSSNSGKSEKNKTNTSSNASQTNNPSSSVKQNTKLSKKKLIEMSLKEVLNTQSTKKQFLEYINKIFDLYNVMSDGNNKLTNTLKEIEKQCPKNDTDCAIVKKCKIVRYDLNENNENIFELEYKNAQNVTNLKQKKDKEKKDKKELAKAEKKLKKTQKEAKEKEKAEKKAKQKGGLFTKVDLKTFLQKNEKLCTKTITQLKSGKQKAIFGNLILYFLIKTINNANNKQIADAKQENKDLSCTINGKDINITKFKKIHVPGKLGMGKQKAIENQYLFKLTNQSINSLEPILKDQTVNVFAKFVIKHFIQLVKCLKPKIDELNSEQSKNSSKEKSDQSKPKNPSNSKKSPSASKQPNSKSSNPKKP